MIFVLALIGSIHRDWERDACNVKPHPLVAMAVDGIYTCISGILYLKETFKRKLQVGHANDSLEN